MCSPWSARCRARRARAYGGAQNVSDRARGAAAVRGGSALCGAHGEPGVRGRARRPAASAHAALRHPLGPRGAALSHRRTCCVESAQCRRLAGTREPRCRLRTERTRGTGRLARGAACPPGATQPAARTPCLGLPGHQRRAEGGGTPTPTLTLTVAAIPTLTLTPACAPQATRGWRRCRLRVARSSRARRWRRPA